MAGHMIIFLLWSAISCQAAQQGPREYFVTEGKGRDTFIGDILLDTGLDRRYDEEARGELRFSFLTKPDFEKNYFHIGEKTGVITLTEVIDRDEICPNQEKCFAKFDVVVQPSQFFQIIKVLVNIRDVNDHVPTFPQTRMRERLSESSLPGTAIGLPVAFDPDSPAFAIQGYELKGRSKDMFELKQTRTLDGETDLRLVLKERLDHEAVRDHRVRVVAIDGGKQQGILHVDISVIDANDNDPHFKNTTYQTHVHEDIKIGDTVIRVEAEDHDAGPNGEVIYTLAKHSVQSYGDKFGIRATTGEVYIKDQLDYEQEKVYQLSITANDRGPDSLPAHATLIVRVLDVNDNAPDIQLSTLTKSGAAEVEEHQPPGTFVAHVSVTDKDSGSNGQFDCNLEKANNNYFVLNKIYDSEYKIITNYRFDREDRHQFNCVIRCTDHGVPAQTRRKIVDVAIVDTNDHTPKFEQETYSASLEENNEKNAMLLTVHANDEDINENGKVTYSLQHEYQDYFTIDKVTGWVRTNCVFDYEDVKGNMYQFFVYATDGAPGEKARTATAEITVSIIDVDDHQPRFKKSSYSFATLENEPPDTEVGYVKAEDPDSERFNRFTYKLDERVGDADKFRLDSLTGKLTTKVSLDREQVGLYNLLAMAISQVNPAHTSTASVYIYVSDINDNPPRFLFPTVHNNTVRISNKSPVGSVIAKLKGKDLDQGANAKLFYSIKSIRTDGQENPGLFEVKESSGSILVKSDLTSIDQQLCVLTVSVADGGVTALSDSTELNILVDRAMAYTSHQHSSFADLFTGESLFIVIAFAAAAVFVIAVILIAVVVLRKRQTQVRRQNCKETEKMLPGSPNHGTYGKVYGTTEENKKYKQTNGSTTHQENDLNAAESSRLLAPHCHGNNMCSDEISIKILSGAVQHQEHDTDSGGSDSGRGPSSEEGAHLRPHHQKPVISHVRFKKSPSLGHRSPTPQSPLLLPSPHHTIDLTNERSDLNGMLHPPPQSTSTPKLDLIHTLPRVRTPSRGPSPEPRNSIMIFDGEYVRYDMCDLDQESTV